MRYGSVCSGIEAATCAWHPLGWEPQFFSEIDKAASSVLARKYPHVPNHGDMTKFQEWPDHAIDLLVGGTPCQSFSVAGLRKGLADPRGNLALTYLAIADRYRPTWLVWENVPGVLSSWSDDPDHPPEDDGDGGQIVHQRNDFDCFLSGLAELGYGFAWRILDAEFVRVESHPWAVPQRRRRVFVVGHLGYWRRAAAVLFERESLSGHPPPRREAGKAAPTIPSRSSACGGLGTDFDCDGGLIAAPLVSPALKARDAKGPSSDGDGDGAPLIAQAMQSSVAHALRGEGHDASEDGTGRGTPIVPIAFPWQQGGTINLSSTLVKNQTMAVAFQPRIGRNGRGYEEEVFPALNGADAGATSDMRPCVAVHDTLSVGASQTTGFMTEVAAHQRSHGWAVRRLTPLECARLMGFPDDYFHVPGKQFADGPIYRLLGNSMAVNCMRWLGERIEQVSKIPSSEAA